MRVVIGAEAMDLGLLGAWRLLAAPNKVTNS